MKAAADPHAAGRLATFGPAAGRARRAVIGLHGRGAGADDMGGLVTSLGFPDIAVYAPEAAGLSWWPTSFLAPADAMEPFVLSALAAVDRAVDAATEDGYDRAQLTLIGFSQGGCLALEYTARRGAVASAVFGLSAGLIGTADAAGPPDDALYGHTPKAFDYEADLSGLPMRVSVHERDPHIPLARSRESVRVLERLDAEATLHVARGAGHGLTEADVAALRAALNG
ncbi:alpha/beta hydrolase [Acuticoccus yangtzensis]|uniref:alpha/beta hydrolase n=1 Tax=Acuticoccus yangtzensis TaxID=1443441 RepID=UPI000949A2FA|nr:dienelactone hydrolase family protein [Acuticoccus yangtzensis]